MDSRRKDTQGISQSRLNNTCVGAPTLSMAQRLIKAAISKRENEDIESLSRTLVEAIRDKHRGFKVSINITRSST